MIGGRRLNNFTIAAIILLVTFVFMLIFGNNSTMMDRFVGTAPQLRSAAAPSLSNSSKNKTGSSKAKASL